jgi:predicted GNAT family acetyltransferase
MEIQQELKGNKGVFFVEQNGERLAEMAYTKAGEQRIIIDHTQVSDVLRGKGIGKQLVKAAVEMARKNKIKILPLCPFARSVFDRVPDFADVWER